MSRRRYPWFGWLGILWMVLTQALYGAGTPLVTTWLTPLMWTGYFLAMDGGIHALGGTSWLVGRRREVPLMILISVGVWLLFEVYNLHLRNWTYGGLPPNPWLRDIGYFWSFATIMPGVFVTGTFLETLVRRRTTRPVASVPLPAPTQAIALLCGAAMVTLPLLVPARVAAYLFAPVWVGFILLLEPINERLGGRSIWARWRAGDRLPGIALLVSGLACGFLWEAWNWQALRGGGGHWIYTIPQPLRIFDLHFGQMPVLGLLGFPPFAWELFAAYEFLRLILGGDRLFGGVQPDLSVGRRSLARARRAG